jgi:hypothetical protein
VFLFPETKWHRLHPTELVSTTPPRSDGASTDKTNGPGNNTHEIEAALADTNAPFPNFAPDAAHQDIFLGKGRPSKAQFKFYQPADIHSSWFIELFTPWKLFLTFPIVIFASFVVSWSASCFLTVNLTQAQNFAAPPYNFGSTVIGEGPSFFSAVQKLNIIGFFNFALLIGTFIGLFTAGPLSDWVSMKLTIRNNGIREPEMRLVAMIPYIFVMILGNVVNAVGYQKKWPWQVCSHP